MTTYREAVEQTITAGEQIHQIVNGTATTEVTVEDGSKVPSIRKALLDNFYFKDPIAWQVGQTENVFNQLRKFTDGSWWYAPSATASNPISMGSTPVGNTLWKIYDFDAIGKLTPQIREALRRSYAEAGYNLVDGSFETGGTLVNVNDVLLQKSTGKAFSGPAGTVAAGTNPTSGGFVDQSGNTTVVIGTYALLRSYVGPSSKIRCLGRSNLFDGASGFFVLDATDTTSADNDGTIIVDALGRRWKRDLTMGVMVSWFGAKGVSTDDSAAIIAANNVAVAAKKKLLFPQGNYYFSANYSFTTRDHHYWEGEQATISFNGNGRMFDINCNWARAIHVKGINFTTLNRVINNNVTGFYLHHGTQFGSSFHFEDCDFSGMTNCSIHAIRAFKYSGINCKFYGASAYSYTSGLLTQYDDAGVRLWGADGTLTVQDHSFSNVGRFENCLFGNCKFGIDGWSVTTSRVVACTFEPCYIGIINRKVDPSIFGNISNVAKGGYGTGQIHLETCWFEQIASYYICGADINPNDGSEAPGQSLAVFQGSGENYTSNVRVHPKTIIRNTGAMVVAARSSPDTTLDNVLLYGFTNNPDVEYVKFGTKSAMVNPLLTLINGVKLGAGSPLTVHETGAFKPALFIGETNQNIPLAGVDGIYTRIGNVVHFSCTLYSNTYAKAGTGNVQLRNLPFASINTVGLLGSCTVTSFNQVIGITNGNVFGEMIAATPSMGFRKPDYQSMTDANLSGSSILSLRISGFYFV